MSTKFQASVERKRIRGTNRMLFAVGALFANRFAVPYRDLGNMIDLGMQPSTEKFEDNDMLGGRKIPIPPEYLSSVVDFNVKLNNLGLQNLKMIFRGVDAPAINQAALAVATEMDPLDFSEVPARIGDYYIITNNGAPLYKPTALVISYEAEDPEDPDIVLTEGVDYVYLIGMAMVRFITAQTKLLKVEATADEFSSTPFEVNKGDPFVGIGMIQTHIKRHSEEEPALLYTPFGCYIDYEEAMTVTVENNTEATIKVRVTDPVPQLIDFRA